ncbi:hypothetical protein [Arachidicoccus soli]|uniref:Uncharacterized protein n=1 Tax=Arachidicoccus soli TaxID=2341117 RepID=A0A386HNS4_9BACT|nr:hypothetical protein [Arachidicoccus soli]AYD47413.1 hypothetical protein D6B99_07190 [Arachidicoccus soli]
MPLLQPNTAVNLPAGRDRVTITSNGGGYLITFHSQPQATRQGVLPVNNNQLVIQLNPQIASTLQNTGNVSFTWV